MAGHWVGSTGERDSTFPLLNGGPLPSSVLTLLPLLPPCKGGAMKWCLKITETLKLRRLHLWKSGDQLAHRGPGSKMGRWEPCSSFSFSSCSLNTFTHCFLLTMKNHDLFGCVLIDSEGMDLPKQKIRLAKNILCHWGKVKLTDLFQSTEALARSCHSISFVHSWSEWSGCRNVPESKLCFHPSSLPRFLKKILFF